MAAIRITRLFRYDHTSRWTYWSPSGPITFYSSGSLSLCIWEQEHIVTSFAANSRNTLIAQLRCGSLSRFCDMLRNLTWAETIYSIGYDQYERSDDVATLHWAYQHYGLRQAEMTSIIQTFDYTLCRTYITMRRVPSVEPKRLHHDILVSMYSMWKASV